MSEPNASVPETVKNIKIEPGLPTSTTRLTSFRLPRDLTLGGNIKTEKPKKVYTPNLNALRSKKKDDSPVVVKPENVKGQKERGRGRGKGDRGRGKGQSKLIQSTGVFSEVTLDRPINRRYGSGSSNDSNRTIVRPVLEKSKLNLDTKIDKDEEDAKLKLLLRDDFIDDGLDPDLENAPVILPMIEEVQLYKQESMTNKIRDKFESTDEIDVKPTLLENGDAVMGKQNVKIKLPADVKEQKKTTTIPEIIDSISNSYFLIQFPDCLPGLQSNSDNDDPRSKDADKSKSESCTFKSLKPGFLGKLQILKSGNCRLQLGENNLIVELGSNMSFRQDLIAAKVDTLNLNGDLINLGSVKTTLICSPDWETMLSRL
ncbi:DNA-directed RNA polymerase III subunit RPC4 [Prorops nasuta]|uniref:DNA-directed RNA polymerase III subunit RPC4 n=1 Tax=Prorops nasuta TaxID=863751 RepID=UPI0034CE5D73